MENFRKVIIARAGGSSIHKLSRAFRIHDDDGNRRLNREEFFEALSACQIDLSTSEKNSIWNEIDRDNNGSVTVDEFLRSLRGKMSQKRLAVIDRAFKAFDSTGDGVVTVEDILEKFDAKRNPAVLKGDKTEREILEEFLETFDRGTIETGEDAIRITKDEFIDYYAGISAGIDHDDHFVALISRAWKLEQTVNAKQSQLKGELKDNFQSSAFRGHREPLPDLPEYTISQKAIAIEGMNQTNSFPLPKPGIVPRSIQGNYETTTPTHHKTKCFRSGAEVVDGGCVPPFEGTRSTVGKVGNGLGFMETTTSTRRGVGTANFDDGVMRAYEEGKAKEREAEALRRQLQNTPFQTPDPNTYVKSSSAHCNMLPALGTDKALTRHSFKPTGTARAPANPTSPLRKPTSGKTKALEWQSTTHFHHAQVNPREVEAANHRTCAQPVAHKNMKVRAEFEETVEVMSRPRERNADGDFSTSYANATAPRPIPDDLKVDRRNNVKGTFKLVNGITVMNPMSHKPRETMPGVEISPKDIVPEQFDPTTKSLSLKKK